MREETGPQSIQSIAVTSGDVVAAYEAHKRTTRRPVLRATPPFSGRMRARLHTPGPSEQETDVDTDLDAETGSLHVPPSRLLAEDTIPPYPCPDETEDALRDDPDAEFSVESHRQRHVEAVESWRRAVCDAVTPQAELQLPSGQHRIEVTMLCDSSVD